AQPGAWHEVICEQAGDTACLQNRCRNQPVVLFAARAPIAAMYEYMQRCTLRRPGWKEDVHGLARPGPIRHISPHPRATAHLAGTRGRFSHDLIEIGDEITVAIEILCHCQKSRAKYLGSMNSYMPVTPPSRPMPLCFAPPKGAAGSDISPRLMAIMPLSIPLPTRRARAMSPE